MPQELIMVQTLEELSLNAWPSLQTKLYDGWVLRFANGYTKRSNSINPLYPSKLPLEQKLDFCEQVYSQQNLPTIFKLTPASLPLEIDELLAQRNYTRLDETSVRLLSMGQYQPRNLEGIWIERAFDSAWQESFFQCVNLEKGVWRETARQILQNILGDVIVVRKMIDRKTVGCGYGAIENGYMGIFDIIVAENYRGKGYGRDLLDGILGAALQRKVQQAYLSVVVGNTLAENLYQSLGFREVYRYWYRKSQA
ncbi:MAG TPA: GNAT family N-acetyltransferase [Bacillota bacterium]|nr:GNAT family N-acetyltransferase [Bacillota bacterium]